MWRGVLRITAPFAASAAAAAVPGGGRGRARGGRVKANIIRGLLEDGLGRLVGRRRPDGGLRLQAEVGERGADVDADGALKGVVLVGVVEGVGLVQLLVGGHELSARGGSTNGGLRLAGGGHDVGRDGEGLLQLLREIAGLGAHGHLLAGSGVSRTLSWVVTSWSSHEGYDFYTQPARNGCWVLLPPLASYPTFVRPLCPPLWTRAAPAPRV